MSEMYSRRANTIHVDADHPMTFKRSLSTKGSVEAFQRDRRIIWNRTTEYLPHIASFIATSYKLGTDIFPSHYDYEGKAYELTEPKVLRSAKRPDRKKKAFIQGVLQSIVADGRRDKLAVLIVGLVHAQKVPHWAGFADEDLSDDAVTEDEAEED